ncbi:hypothetical protein K8942_03570 [Candidatus Peribacteria bacterium]|nr:MAG: hypothetical protein K8942_03570 [Candidatus Peribacteria bacterium]
MPLFSYIARDERGRIDRGTMDAASMDSVRESLKAKGLSVEEILETRIPVAQARPVGFTPSMPWTTIEDKKEEKKTEKAMETEERAYIPLIETLRLFAGWLLAWYGAVYLLGNLTLQEKLPVYIPYLNALFTSSLVLRFTFGTFLFLLLTSLYSAMGRGVGKGIVLTIMGVAMFVLFHLNV